MEVGRILGARLPHTLEVDEDALLKTPLHSSEPVFDPERFGGHFWDLGKDILVDITFEDKKMSFLSSEEIFERYTLSKKDFVFSGCSHVALVSVGFLTIALFSAPPPMSEQVVEVAFGLSAEPTRSRLDTEGEEDVQATRTKQDLAQLTKNAAPDLAPKAQEEPSPDSPVIKEEPKKEEPNKNKAEQKPEGEKPREDQQKVAVEDYLKRKEQDLRAVDETKKQGQKRTETPKTAQKQKSSKDHLPKSPFGSDVPDAPEGIAPAGLETGTSTKAYDSYKTYLARQLKLNWQTAEGSQFSSDLVTIVKFTVNPFGHLMGEPQVTKSSGSSEFDTLALEAVKATFPVTTKPPATLNPPVSFSARYTSQGVM